MQISICDNQPGSCCLTTDALSRLRKKRRQRTGKTTSMDSPEGLSIYSPLTQFEDKLARGAHRHCIHPTLFHRCYLSSALPQVHPGLMIKDARQIPCKVMYCRLRCSGDLIQYNPVLSTYWASMFQGYPPSPHGVLPGPHPLGPHSLPIHAASTPHLSVLESTFKPTSVGRMAS